MVFTKRLTLYAAAAIIALVGWVLNVASLYWMAGTLVMLEQVGRLVTLAEQRGLAVSRRIPAAGHQGETVPVRLQVRNLLPIPKLHLSVRDVLPPGLTALDAEPLPIHLPPRGEDGVEYQALLGRRGAHALAEVRVEGTDPLGLRIRETRHACASEILVYPRVVELPHDVLPRDLGGGLAPMENAGRQGQGSGFYGIREYRPGDPLRHVHWRTAARLGRLAVVEWEAEESRDVLIAIETRQGTEQDLGMGTTLDLAAGAAASLAARVLGEGHSLRLLAPGSSEWRAAADRGEPALSAILEILARMRADSAVSAAAELRRAAPHTSAGTLVCWFTPAADEHLAETVRFLLAARLRPVIYSLADGEPGGPASWEALVGEFARLGVPVVRLDRNEDLVRRILC